MASRNPAKPVAPDATFTPELVQAILKNAFIAAVRPTSGVLSERRLAYCRDFAKLLCERIDESDIKPGHFTHQESVAILVGAALAIQTLHCKIEAVVEDKK